MSCVLVVAPHPDDEVLGCGGVIARDAARGDDVYVVVVSKGAADVFPPELVEQVRQEAAVANKVLGTKRMFFLDFPAPMLDTVPGYQLTAAIKEVILDLRPSAIYLPHRGDIHSDHRAVYWAGMAASRPTGKADPAVLCYETLSETEWGPPTGSEAFVPNVFVNISSHLQTKLAAMACYRSQLKDEPHPRSLAAIERLAGLRGAAVCVPAAEGFMLTRQIVA